MIGDAPTPGGEPGPPAEAVESTLLLHSCHACGHTVFPRRLLCPRCGAGEFRDVPAVLGVLEECTTNRRGEAIGSVRTDSGPVVLARLDQVIEPGMRVRLAYGQGVVARPDRAEEGT